MELVSDKTARLDVFISENASVSRSRAETLIKQGLVSVNALVRSKAGYELKPGDRVEFTLPEPEPTDILPQDIPLKIVYEDENLAVVYKPSGMVVHPAAGNPDGTLVNALLAALSSLSLVGGVERPGIVHRIDKDTSGLLLVAKTDLAHRSLSEQIAAHSVERIYKAIVCGHFRETEGQVDAPIGRHPTDRKKMAIVPGGRSAVTNWRVLEELRGASLIECRLTTGRTHQIRVHMASLNHPVLGDPVYGFKKPPYNVEGGQLLHAGVIGFDHPVTGERMRFEAEPEERFTAWLEKLRL
ncbi:MAG: RluA family pseudouridine synthase [Clostridia bacterium]|nr:RluA family pseudouridine synthase [Clostridia bacterium]MBR5257923.1 RluA family pseudouridine synthase [Clostridia bacterium]MBR6498227.1 RluA family pseudouridine synthase [Clostridia bacterium]